MHPAPAVGNGPLFANTTDEQFVQKAYDLIQKRQPNSGDVSYWVNSIRNNNRFAVLIWMFMSAESSQKNNLAADQDYVEGLYEVFLGRASDAPGKQFWLNTLYTNGREITGNEFVKNSAVRALLGLESQDLGPLKTRISMTDNYLMSSVITPMNWEEFFIQESLELEEKMALLDMESLQKSRIRIALEQGILDWNHYLAWSMQRLPCSQLVVSNDDVFMEQLVQHSKDLMNTYSHFNHWNEDLIPLLSWNNTLIILGLQYNEHLSELENVVFVIATPELTNKIYVKARELTSDSAFENDSSGEQLLSFEEKLDNLDLEMSAPKISFASLTGHANANANLNSDLSEKTNAEESTNVTNIENVEFWDYVVDRHEEYSFEAKKQFDAYLVLKISQGKTKVFKTDDELEKKGLKESDFSFDIKEDNPFHTVFYSENSVVFNVSQIQKNFKFNLQPYQYMCISALKRGGEVLGFLVGLKKSTLSEKDETLLNELAKESA